MGVRGLTTYIERNKNIYLQKHELRDTYLVIDGYSLCAQLYKYQAKCNDIYGGDYDHFARCIEHFFAVLKQCNITPILVLDGGYETKKIKTVYSRLSSKLKTLRDINPVRAEGCTIFPLFVREVFKDTLLKLKVAMVRCDYEADLDIACVARRLNCPVLSYDSDFYIFDVLYIPFLTLETHCTKLSLPEGTKYCLNCKIYDVDRFLKKCGLTKIHLPLLATLLGNDYIKKSTFKKFFTHLKLPKKNVTRSDQYRLIMALIDWLKTETFDSAIQKILSRLKQKRRVYVTKRIEEITQGYLSSNSEIFQYLGLEKSEDPKPIQIAIEDIKIETTDSDTSDEDSSADEDIIPIEECTDLPKSEWFINNYRKGNFPTLYIDLLTLNTCIYLPQIEDLTNLETFKITIPLVQAISKILLQDKKTTEKFKKIIYLARNTSHVKKHYYPMSNMKLPNIQEIESLKTEICKKTLLEILNITEEDFKTISPLPKNWYLYFISLIYWTKHAVIPKVNTCHIYAIIICLLNLNIVDKKTSALRLKKVFLKKYETRLNTQDKIKFEPENKSLDKIIKNVRLEDCLHFINSFIQNFAPDERLKTNKKLFSIQTVDAFAQFQSCLLYINHLNSLLNYPFLSVDISEFYNGTFMYNLYQNFEKRNDVNMYINLKLKDSRCLRYIFQSIIDILKPVANLSVVVCLNKKRKKRKKKENVVNIDEKSDVNTEDNEDEIGLYDGLYDENNKFSILSLQE